MSARKCSSCGQTTKSEVPFCSNCGALFPIGDEKELMRQVIGASFDLKWVFVGAIIVVVLQLGLLAGLWSAWGKKMLVGEKGRSLLDVNLDSIAPTWGPNSGGTRVTLTIKPDNKNINTATKVVSVLFSGVKAKPFHVQHLAREKKECASKCANQIKTAQEHTECMKVCDPKQLKKHKDDVAKCWKPCEDVDNDKELTKEKKEAAKRKLKCGVCEKQLQAYSKRKHRCTKVCPAKKKSADAERGRCRICKKAMPVYEARAKQCKARVTQCWAYKDDRGRKAAPTMPDRAKYKDDKAFRAALTQYRKTVKDTKLDNKRAAERERKQLRTLVNVYTPVAPGKLGHSEVRIIFKSGEQLTKRQGFFFVDAKKKDKRPKIKKKKKRLHDPVRTLGFWILLVGSCLFYFLGGFAVGRISPSIGAKEPLTAALFAWIVFEVVLFVLGAAGSAQLFTVFIGAPAFIGSAILGAALGERSAEV